jgi:phospholipid/cholesterol/gamma-HCH transport system substrate-binding protein
VFRPTTVTAFFTTATAIYPGDDVRIAGVKVGTISAIVPDGPQAKLVLRVDHGVAVPAEAKAVVVAQNLISARYVQLAPLYQSGPRMADGAVIPVERTAVPVEWDEVKAQLTRLATDLGPEAGGSGTSVGRFIDSAANAMHDNGKALHQTLSQLSGVGRILAHGSGNIAETITNLQTFVTALRDSNTQIVQFQDRLATLTSVLDGSKSDLDAALTNLSGVIGDVHRFISDTRDKTSEQVQRLADVTQNLVDHRQDLEQVLHVAAPALSNTYNMFDPRTGAATGTFVFNPFSDPAKLFCSNISALENATSGETAKICNETVGADLKTVSVNALPIPVNFLLSPMPPPDELRYSDPSLAPGGSGPRPVPPEQAPSVSAYSGLPGDNPPPAGPPPGPLPGMMAPTSLPDLLLAPQPGAPTPGGGPPTP